MVPEDLSDGGPGPCETFDFTIPGPGREEKGGQKGAKRGSEEGPKGVRLN